MIANLNMPTRFSILKSPNQDATGRLFLTMPEGEFRFLEFQKYLKDMMQNLALYNVLISTSGRVNSIKFDYKHIKQPNE